MLRHKVKKLHESLDGTELKSVRIPLSESSRTCDEIAEKHCALLQSGEWSSQNAPQDDLKDRLHRLCLCQIGLLTQQHNYHHVDSCFKKSSEASSGTCRYKFPRKSGLPTHVDDDGVLRIGRDIHNECINCFNDVMILVFRSNHDIRFLLGCGTTDALYYCLKYVTKAQKEVDPVELRALLISSYDRRRRKELEQE